MTDLEDLVLRLQSLVNQASQALNPDDDFNPILAIMMEDQLRYRVLDPALFHPSKRKLLYEKALPGLLHSMEPDLAAMVVMLRYFEVEDLKSDENWDLFKKALGGKLMMPETTEGVLIAAYSREEESLWVSKITRVENEPPLLGMWARLPDQIYSETVEALRLGMHGLRDQD